MVEPGAYAEGNGEDFIGMTICGKVSLPGDR